MTTPDGYRLISTDRTRAQEILHVVSFAFAFTVPQREADFVERIYPWDAARGVEVLDPSKGAPGRLAGSHSSFRFRLAVPGSRTVPCAGLSWVSVHPGHRRRGILRAMIEDHFARSLERGEPVSALYASETQIYQRFGYGLAARGAVMELARGTELRDVEGADDLIVEIDSASIERHGDTVRAVQSRLTRPGSIVEFGDEVLEDVFLDLESEREGADELRIAIVRDGDEPLAWALLNRKGKWEMSGPDGKVTVKVWASADVRATARLARVLVDVDLMSKTAIDHVALDHEILHLLKDPRAAREAVLDNLWVRILDVPAALEGRGWAADCDVSVRITDAQVPANAATWRVEARDGGAVVTRTDQPADLAMDIQELAAAYLGGTSIATLARAGLVTEHTAGAVAALSRAMTSDLAPVSNIGF
ncbi:GNAT family N-acetyltransferase [Demequina sp. NBRC 110053]|uniref:GNAT family N-acetyltransferase n=1 Tax=Demequina sp. NBRC 110053 TaxID=1570342 RepID=UPI000A040C54|nr:GNAT family N-acetyltransferase [Demequina sp. NBRC 110053]